MANHFSSALVLVALIGSFVAVTGDARIRAGRQQS